MASAVDICNLALARLGDSATLSSIDPPEGSAQAEHAARFYPVARDTLLEQHAWNFATLRADMPLIGSPPAEWQFSYALPVNYIRALSIFSKGSSEEPQPYVIENFADGTSRVYTNVQNAVIKYIARVTDTTKFSPMFVNALSMLLAHYMAGPLIKGTEGIKVANAMYNLYVQTLLSAAAHDSNARHYNPAEQYVPEWVRSYGIGESRGS